MHLELSVIASAAIKRKKPWPRLGWLGKDQGSLYLLDDRRISQLFLPSGKTRKKIPSLQSVISDAEVLNISPNGLYLAGALSSGKVFVWHKDSESIKWTLVLDKIRNVISSVFPKPKLFVSNCGEKVLLIFAINQIFLWETDKKSRGDGSGGGRWFHVQSGDCCLPHESDKEMAIDGIFYLDSVLGVCGTCAWTLNKNDKIQISTLKLHWPTAAQQFDESKDGFHAEQPTFTAKWSSFAHPLFGLTSARRVLKSRKSYVSRFSPDGQVLAVALNQKIATDNKLLFFGPGNIPVAVVADLKGCGAGDRGSKQVSGRSWWVADMGWTSDSLFLVCITKRGSVAIVTKLGEPVQFSVSGCSIDMGPGIFLPLHPKMLFKKTTVTEDKDSSMSTISEKDALKQKFSISVHPRLPVLLSSDGYLVTIIQIPNSLNPLSVVNSLVADVARLVPEIKFELGNQNHNESQFSCENRVNLLQTGACLQPGGMEMDSVSLQSFSSGSSIVPGYGLASGEQGFFGHEDTTDIGSLGGDIPVDIDCSQEVRNISLKALGIATACAGNWKREYAAARNPVVCAVAGVFQLLIKRKRSHSTPVKERPVDTLKFLPRSLREFITDDSSVLHDKVVLEDALDFYKMAIELFKWDFLHQNVLSWAVHMTGCVIRKLLSTRTLDDLKKVSGCLQLLKYAERLLTHIYCRVTEDGARDTCGLVPVNQGDTVQYSSNESAANERPNDICTEVPCSSVSNQLSGLWLTLYQYISQTNRKSHPPARSQSPGSRQSLLAYLCEVQKKLQELGVRIPTQADNESPSYFKELKQHSLKDLNSSPARTQDLNPQTSADLPLQQDSMFARRRKKQTSSHDETQTSLDKSLAVALFNRSSYNKQPRAVDSEATDSQTMLSILYMNLQEYDIKSAVNLVSSLLEPASCLEQAGLEANSSFIMESSFMTSDHGPNSMLRIILQSFPIARVVEQKGIEVVQTFARVMAAYFSNLPLYVFSPYSPHPLPPFNFGQEKDKQDWETPQSLQIAELDRTKVSKAVREQGLSAVWSANSTLELMLVSGLLAEASWLAQNLGDWKHAFLLSVAHHNFEDKRRSVVVMSPGSNIMFPGALEDLQPEELILSRLEPMFLNKKQQINYAEGNLSETKVMQGKNTEIGSKKNESDVDEKLSRELSRIFEASVVIGIDIVPTLLTNLIGKLKTRVKSFHWIVPQEFYLPSPPLYCPQPPYTKDSASIEVQEERIIRSDVVNLIQKILMVLQSSRCALRCVRWYTGQLLECCEKWYGLQRDHQDFPVLPSLVEWATTGSDFTDGIPREKGNKKFSPKKDKVTGRPNLLPSVCTVIKCFREFCHVMWLIHVRDEMSASARKYHSRRAQVTGRKEAEDGVTQQCWETIHWTSRMIPFGEFLGCGREVRDALLTLISELPPQPSTAEVCAQFFHDPGSVESISEKAKFKRLMAEFRSVTLEETDGGVHEETLSMLYRRKSLEWQGEMKQRRKVIGGVRVHVFETRANGNKPGKKKERPGSANKGKLEDPVGSLVLETDQSYFEFLDTFFIITFSKPSSLQPHVTDLIPVLLPYSEHFLGADTRTLAEIKRKKKAESTSKPVTERNLFRSHSFTDIRSSKINSGNLPHSGKLTNDDGSVKRVSSLNDLQRVGTNSGFDILGTDLLDMLPTLVWLNRWIHEGGSSAGSILDISTSSVSRTHPHMRVHVPLPLVINCMWLLKNIYFPWVTKSRPSWKPGGNLEDVTSRYNLMLPGDSLAHPSSKLSGVSSPSTTEVSPAHHVAAASLHVADADIADAREATELIATNRDEVPAIVVQSPTSDEATFTLGRSVASKRRDKQRKKSLADVSNSEDTETDSEKKIERRQKRESRSISKRNISGKVNGPRSQSDVIGVEPTDEDIQQADLNTSKVNVAMATITRTKPPRPSTVATEETHISSNFDPSDIGEASSWMSCLGEDVEPPLNPKTRIPSASQRTLSKARTKKEHQQVQPFIQRDEIEQDGMEVFLIVRSKDDSGKSTTIRTGIPLIKPSEDTSKQDSCAPAATLQAVDPYQNGTSQHSFIEQQNWFVQTAAISNKSSAATQTSSENEIGEDRLNEHVKGSEGPSFQEQPSVRSSNLWCERDVSIATQTSSGLDDVIPANAPLISFGTQTDLIIPCESTSVQQYEKPQQHFGHFLKLENTCSPSQTVHVPLSRPLGPGPRLVNANPRSDSSSQVPVLEADNPRIAWPSVSVDLPLLHMPSKPLESDKRPDLSKIKFPDAFPKPSVQPLTNVSNKSIHAVEGLNQGKIFSSNLNVLNSGWPLLHFTKPEQTKMPDLNKMRLLEKSNHHGNPTQANNWPLLHLPKTERSQKPDLNKMKLLNKPAMRKDVELELLKLPPSQQPPPTLVPYEQLLAFEQRRAKPEEKENVLPADIPWMPSGPGRMRSQGEILKQTEDTPTSQSLKLIQVQPTETDQRNTALRQRRRHRINKSAMEISQQQKTINRICSHSRSTQTIRARKKVVKKEPTSSPSLKKTKKIPTEGRKQSRAKETVYYESVSEESELELSELSNLDSLSEDEKYSNVDAPQPVQSTSSVLKHFEIPGPPVLMHYQRKRALEEEDGKQTIHNPLFTRTDLRKNESESKEKLRLGDYVGNKIREIPKGTIPSKNDFKNIKTTSDKGVSVSIEDDAFKPQVGERKAIGIQVDSATVTPWKDTDVPTQATSRRNETKAVLVQTDEALPLTHTGTKGGHAPALPPDIFLNLQFPGDDISDDDVKDAPSTVPSTSVVPPSDHSGKRNDQLTFTNQSGRQFLSVADIDHDEWVNSSPKSFSHPNNEQLGRRFSQPLATFSHEAEISEKEALLEKERQEISADETKQRPSLSTSDSVTNAVTFPARSSGPDSLTVRLLDSSDSSLKSSQHRDPRTASKKWITEHMKQMSQTMDAIEQVNEDMDRDLHSSRMLMNAIERLGEAVYPVQEPSYSKLKFSRLKDPQDEVTRSYHLSQQESADGVIVSEREDISKEHENENESDIDLASPRDDRETAEQTIHTDSQSTADDARTSVSRSLSQVSELRSNKYVDESSQSTAKSRASGDGDEMSLTGEQSEKQKLDTPRHGGKQLVPLSMQTEPGTKDPRQSLKLTQEKLKKILGQDDKTSSGLHKRTREKRKELREWMNKRRVEQHNKWTNKIEELRAAEHKPFVSEGASDSKKIKLAEKERTVKRKEREGEHYEERMKSATKLLSDMLTEQIPETNASKRNLRYSLAERSVRARSKQPFNDRYKRKALSMRSDKQQLAIKKDGRPHDITNDLADVGTEIWRHSTPVWSVTDDIRRDDQIHVKEKPHRTQTPTAQEFVTLDTYRRLEAEKLKKLQEFDESSTATIDAVTQELLSSDKTSGPNFITRKSWERYQREKSQNSSELQEAEHLLRQYGELEPKLHDNPVARRKEDVQKISRRDSQESYNLTDVDKLLEDIPDGSSMDDLRGLQSLMNEDSELKELLAGVFSGTNSPDAENIHEPQSKDTFTRTIHRGNEVLPMGTYKVNQDPLAPNAPGTRERAPERKKPIPRPRANSKHGEKAASRGPSGELDNTVTPWTTNDTLTESEDIAKLLAEAKEAVGEDFSESSGSIMSNIDWQAVDRIMDEM